MWFVPKDEPIHETANAHLIVQSDPINNAANLSMFMVRVSAKLMEKDISQAPEYSVLDLKSHYRGQKYLDEILKGLSQKPEPIVIQQINQRLSSIGAIHNRQISFNPG